MIIPAEKIKRNLSEKLQRMRNSRKSAELEATGRTGTPRVILEAGSGFGLPAVSPVKNNRLELLGVSFELGIDNFWNTSGDAAEPWPEYFYSDINLMHTTFGDYKLIWELGRLQFLPALLEKDPEIGKALLKSFMDEVRPLWSIHWYSEMEIGIRMISLIQCLGLLETDSKLFDRCVAAINIHYNFLRDNLTTHWRVRNNHILIECSALLIYEMLFDCPQRQQRLTQHWQLLEDETAQQIYSDGGLREQTVGYTSFNLQAFLLASVVCVASQTAIPSWLGRTIANMLNWLKAVQLPDGHWPMIGDADDGNVGRFAAGNDNWDFQYLFDLASELGLYKPAANSENSLLLKESGYWIFTNAADKLILRAGEFGLGGDGAAPHSHCDELSFILSLKGQTIFTDCGTFSYESRGEQSLRNIMRSCPSHNVLTVDGQPQAEPRGNFSWGLTPNCRIVAAGKDHAKAVFEDFQNLYVWHRQIDCRDGGFEITDTVEPNDENPHELKWYFNLAPNLTAETDGPLAIVKNGSETVAKLQCSSELAITTTRGIYSEKYNRNKDITRLQASLTCSGSVTVKWLIS